MKCFRILIYAFSAKEIVENKIKAKLKHVDWRTSAIYVQFGAHLRASKCLLST